MLELQGRTVVGTACGLGKDGNRGRSAPAPGPHLRARCASPSHVFQLLEENDQLIRCIVEYQNKGRANECVQ